MTTLIGMKVEKGKEAVILASDLSRTQTRWSAEGDVAYRQQTRSEGQKIYVDDKREIALCMSGNFDQFYIDFLSRVLNGNIDVKKAITKGYFSEFLDLNLKRWEGRVPDSKYMNGLLLATRFDKPTLYTCWPLGRIEERVCTSIGSGSEYALAHISKQGKLIPKRLTLEEGIDLSIASLDEASQDIYTGGLDLVVVTQEGIKEFGNGITNAIKSAKKEIIQKIKTNLQDNINPTSDGIPF